LRVLISDNFSAAGLKLFDEADGIVADYRPGITHDKILNCISDYDALVVRGGTCVDEALIKAGTRLKIIARAGIGVENIDMVAANTHGIVITNTPLGSTTTIAEHAIALMMALARLIPPAHQSMLKGAWQPAEFLGSDINGKTLGVIGGGKIGRRVIEYARGLHMHVDLYDPYLSEEVITRLGAHKVSLTNLLSHADFISLHLPLTLETENILNRDTFASMKPGCRLINCALGGLIDEKAMLEALDTGILAGAALDTFAMEPPHPDNPLIHHPKVICTPHLRAATIDAQTNVTVQAAQQVIDFLQSGTVRNALNVPSVSSDHLEALRPYLDLAERMGLFLSQLLRTPFNAIAIDYSGDMTSHPMEPLTMAILKGFLTPIIGTRINYVNAPHVVRERGITVTETRRNVADGFSNMIELTVSGEQGRQSIRGAIFSNRECRIIGVDDYSIETVPSGHLLVVKNQDRPGVIALLGRLLADAEINVAMMNLSRRKASGDAMSLLTVDQKIPDPVMTALRQHEWILSAVQIDLP
jgi:D-3-phosphoglycerate dehydrogenase